MIKCAHIQEHVHIFCPAGRTGAEISRTLFDNERPIRANAKCPGLDSPIFDSQPLCACGVQSQTHARLVGIRLRLLSERARLGSREVSITGFGWIDAEYYSYYY